MKLTESIKGHLALFGAQLIYALNYSIAKGLMPNAIGPLALVFFRIIGACAFFWLLSLFVKTQKIEKQDLKKMMWLTLFGVVINQVFFIYGLSKTFPINSSIVMISNPIMVFMFTMLVLKQKITWFNFSGLALAICGALILLLYHNNLQFGSQTVMGDCMTLINATSWAIFVVLIKPIMQKYNTVTVMRTMFLFGSIYIIPIGLADAINTNYQGFTLQIIGALFFVVFATTFLAYLLNIYGLQSLSPNVVSMYIYLQPFLASFFAIVFGKDELTLTKIVSGILIICGLYLINLKSKKIQHA